MSIQQTHQQALFKPFSFAITIVIMAEAAVCGFQILETENHCYSLLF